MWKILDFNQQYEVSTEGQVRRIRDNFYPKYCKDKDGYMSCSLNNGDGTKTKYRVHRLIAMAFIPNPENKPEVNHINSIRDDNRAENLEWCTRSENEKHAYRDGRHQDLKDRARENLLKYAVKAISVPVRQFDLNGKFIAEYPSISEASRKTGINATSISQASQGQKELAGGYKWERIPKS